MKKTIAVVAAVAALFGACGESAVESNRPSHTFSADENALLDWLAKQRLSTQERAKALELLGRVRLAAVQFEGKEGFPFALEETIRQQGGAVTDHALMALRPGVTDPTAEGSTVVTGHRPLVVLEAARGPNEALGTLASIREHGFRPFDVLLVYNPPAEVRAETERLSNEAVRAVWEALTAVKGECPQLSEWGPECLRATSPLSPRQPRLNLDFSYGVVTSGGMADYRVTYTTPNWCCIRLWLDEESLRRQGVFDSPAVVPGRCLQHWIYPRQGWFAHWAVESGDPAFTARVNGVVEQALGPLRESEQRLGGDVIRNWDLRTF